MANLERIKKEISILELAKDLGYTIMRIGNSYTLKEHDSVRISEKENLFMQFSTGISGSNIDFLINFGNMDIKEAIKYLDKKMQDMGYIDTTFKPVFKEKEKEKIEFVLPKKDQSIKNVYAYLITTRGIDKDIVSNFVKNKMLYQDTYKNCVFVSPSIDNPKFANLRGTNTHKKFIGDVKGSDYNHCFFIDNKAKDLIITESVIDLMSSMQIVKMKGKDIESYNYLALSGTQKIQTALHHHLLINDYDNVILCLDNDDAGSRAIDSAKDIIMLMGNKENIIEYRPLYVKDMNDYLKQLTSENSIEYVSLMYEKEFSFMTGNDLKYQSEIVFNEYNKEIAEGKLNKDTSLKDYVNYRIEIDKAEVEDLIEFEKQLKEDEVALATPFYKDQENKIEIEVDDELEI